eukprot:9386217-Ditylum_brightwellii.AAC.1
MSADQLIKAIFGIFILMQCPNKDVMAAALATVLAWEPNLCSEFLIRTDVANPCLIVLWGLAHLYSHPACPINYAGTCSAFIHDICHPDNVPPVITINSTWFVAKSNPVPTAVSAITAITFLNVNNTMLPGNPLQAAKVHLTVAMFIPGVLLLLLLSQGLTLSQALSILSALATTHGIHAACQPLFT